MADASVSHTTGHGGFSPLWLPPGGHGNDLTAVGWAPVADLPAAIIEAVLDLLSTAGIPAYTAPAPLPVRNTLPAAPQRGDLWRLWVGSTSFAHAENLLVDRLPALLSSLRVSDGEAER